MRVGIARKRKVRFFTRKLKKSSFKHRIIVSSFRYLTGGVFSIQSSKCKNFSYRLEYYFFAAVIIELL